jgi:pimeloyl-ACP methyl ester carboxylesterase
MKPRVLLTDVAGEGFPLVLIPGGVTGWLSWIPHQESLKQDFRVIRVQPIHNELGSAGMVGDPTYSHEVAVESLRLTMEDFGIETAHFAGWSAGGKGLLDFALTYPDAPLSLTLVEPAARWVVEQSGMMKDSWSEENDFLAAISGQEVTDDDFARFLTLAGFVSEAAQARADPYWDRGWPHRMTLSWLWAAVMGSDHDLADLAALECPVLLTKGTRSAEVDRTIVDVLGAHLRNSTLAEFEGTHAHHLEDMDSWLAALRQNLSRA